MYQCIDRDVHSTQIVKNILANMDIGYAIYVTVKLLTTFAFVTLDSKERIAKKVRNMEKFGQMLTYQLNIKQTFVCLQKLSAQDNPNNNIKSHSAFLQTASGRNKVNKLKIS